MGIKRVQPKDIIKMNELYIQVGTYAAVARAVGFSASTVKRYIQADYVPRASMEPVEQIKFEIPSIGQLKYPKNWNEFLTLTEEEKINVEKLQKTILL